MELHKCSWPSCKQEISTTTWACSKHWFNLPWRLRAKLYETYVYGEPSIANTATEDEVYEYIDEHFPLSERS